MNVSSNRLKQRADQQNERTDSLKEKVKNL